MLKNWLNPTDICHSDFLSDKIGANISPKDDLKSNKIRTTILSTSHKSVHSIKESLYQLYDHFNDLIIRDAGVLKKKNVAFSIPSLTELQESKHAVVFLAPSEEFLESLFYSHKNAKGSTRIVYINPQIDLSNNRTSFISKILGDESLDSFQLAAFQNHFSSPTSLSFFGQTFSHHLRLGEIKNNPQQSETLLRDANILSFNIAALKNAHAPGQQFLSPNGLTGEEACQITRYAGLSENLRIFGIFGFNEHELDPQTSACIAQMIWYFWQGLNERTNDYPIQLKELQEHVVDVNYKRQEIKFWKSKKSGRWWFQLPSLDKSRKPKLLPCTIDDYRKACKEELSDRIIKEIDHALD